VGKSKKGRIKAKNQVKGGQSAKQTDLKSNVPFGGSKIGRQRVAKTTDTSPDAGGNRKARRAAAALKRRRKE
jgi:hypothetical protein